MTLTSSPRLPLAEANPALSSYGTAEADNGVVTSVVPLAKLLKRRKKRVTDNFPVQRRKELTQIAHCADAVCC